MKRRSQNSAPRRPRQGRYQPDNIALMPASMLPFKDEWQAIAARLPLGVVLLVVPNDESAMKRRMRRVASVLQLQGHRTSTVTLRFNVNDEDCLEDKTSLNVFHRTMVGA